MCMKQISALRILPALSLGQTNNAGIMFANTNPVNEWHVQLYVAVAVTIVDMTTFYT